MPHTIPFDSTLVLGNIVNPAKIAKLAELDAAESAISTIKDEINGLILEKRSLSMTLSEIANMSAGMEAIEGLEAAIQAVDKQIGAAAEKLAKVIPKQSSVIQNLKKEIRGIGGSIESPLDYSKIKFKKDLPLSADSMTMDSQYFHFEENVQSSAQTISAIKSYVSTQISDLGYEYSNQVSEAAQSQASEQYQRHSIQGTLVITCKCTHKNAVIIEPMELNLGKAIRVWNAALKDGQLQESTAAPLDPTNPEKMMEVMSGEADKNALMLLSGATYGSSFVAMVHILNTTKTTSSQDVSSFTTVIQEQAKEELYLSSVSGGFGVSDSFSESVKNMMSKQTITSHINVICMGLIPSVKANEIEFAVKQFSDFSPDKTMGQLAELNNATASDQQTIDSAANASRTGAQMQNLHAAQVKSVMSSVSTIQHESNRVFNVNSLMTAFDDYIKKAGEGEIGVPINFYLAPITAKQIATMWIRKYYPDNQFLGVNPITNKSDDKKDDGGGKTSEGDGDKGEDDKS